MRSLAQIVAQTQRRRSLGTIVGQVKRRRTRPLTLISNGLGRDSATIIALLVQGKLVMDGKRVRPSDIDLVVFADPGSEWKFTYDVAGVLGELLDAVGVAHVTLEKPPAEQWEPWLSQKRALASHLMAQGVRGRAFTNAVNAWSRANPPPWLSTDWGAAALVSGRSLWQQKAAEGGYHRRPPIFAEREALGWGTYIKAHACTIGHKIEPIDALLHDLTVERWGIPLRSGRRGGDSWEARVAAGQAQPHRMVIGMAADELRRVQRGRKAMAKIGWKRGVYPLVEMGISKDDEDVILRDVRFGGRQIDLSWIRKSGCFICHYQPVDWFWALRETEPAVFAQVVAYERRANRKNPNYSIKGILRVTTKRDALPRLVAAGIRAAGQQELFPGQAVRGLDRALNKDQALALLAQVDPEALRPIFIDELVETWRRDNPRATVSEVLAKSYERCGAF